MDKILILNDDPTLLELQKRLIIAHMNPNRRVRVVTAADVPEAQGKLITATPVLILADPGASEGIRHLAGSRATEVVCVTGHPKHSIPNQPLEVKVEDIIEIGKDGAFTAWIKEWFEMMDLALPA